MRHLKPLHLPAIVAAKTPSFTQGDDVAVRSRLSISTSASSYCTSDSSTPPTPTFSLRGHSRFPSSTSSLASSATSPVCENGDVTGSATKLPMPKLTEEPTELDESASEDYHGFQHSFSPYDLDSDDEGDHSTRTTVLLRDSHFYDLDSELFGDDNDAARSRALRRQKSSDSPLHSFSLSSKLGERFPSFSKRWRDRRPAKLVTGLGIQTVPASRPASSRTSSAGSCHHFQSFDQNDEIPATPAMSNAGDMSTPVSPMDIVRPMELPQQEQAFATTPLLPPMMNAPIEKQVHVQSPLQSPTIADPDKTLSMVSIVTPAQTPQMQARTSVSSPTLSTKPSMASINRTRTTTMPSPVTMDTAPLFIADPNDEWSLKLGHANFTISPEPYLPEASNTQTCRVLFGDWETARANYFRHKHRVVEHYGGNSKTFKLTEQKWAAIDAEWRKYHDRVTSLAGYRSTDALPLMPAEPTMLTMIPTLNDPQSAGKFPKLGDQDIVGQMVQVAPQPQVPSKFSSFIKTMFRGRSRSATR
ncbi:hypothetical protein E2P81_ATG07859 [Venturia nashicola]|nr:hypothetical protein E2P81_ATG07859 [Venturia nashicola]